MNLDHYFNQLDIEEIYRTILDLEGPKHPLYNWEALDSAAEYIYEKLKSYGIKTEFQEFFIHGFEKPFKNIIGYLGDFSQPAIVLGSHYDTVINTPGANDNLSAVAISLEVARVLSKLENPPTVIIASFTLEEGYPTFYKELYKSLRVKGLIDSKDRLTSYKLLQFDRRLDKLFFEKLKERKIPITDIYKTILEERKDDFSKIEAEYTNMVSTAFVEMDDLYIEKKVPNNYALVGSTMFVDKVLKENINIKYMINFDTLGWISNKEGTQKPLPVTDEMLPLTSCYKMDIKGTTGNFINVIANKNAKNILDSYIQQLSDPKIDMPCFGLYLPFDMDMIYASAPDTLRSDHAPFWAENIPGIFVSDSANFRSPYYHTAEDKHTHINFNALLKIAKATLGIVLLP
jgi:hypothetical protein